MISSFTFQPSDTNPFADHAKYRSGRKIPLPSSTPKQYHRRRIVGANHAKSIDNDTTIFMLPLSPISLNDDDDDESAIIPIRSDDDDDGDDSEIENGDDDVNEVRCRRRYNNSRKSAANILDRHLA